MSVCHFNLHCLGSLWSKETFSVGFFCWSLLHSSLCS